LEVSIRPQRLQGLKNLQDLLKEPGGVLMARDDRFLEACRLRKTDCTPIWLMRQAGRYMREYREIRSRYPLLTMFKTPEIATEVTLQPVRAFEVDAAIIFADILLPLEGMGIRLEFAEGEGPVIRNPVRTPADASALRLATPEEHLGYVLDSLRAVRAELAGKIPLIGFAGAPFTLASYMIEGGSSRNYVFTKKMMYHERDSWNLVMSKLSETIGRYLVAQASAGAQVVQLFDSWAGCLSPADYREYVLPHTAAVFQKLREAGIPSIHFGTGTADLLTLMREAGGDVIGVDWRTNLDEGWKRIGPDTAVQGNLDPVLLMAPVDILRERAGDVLRRAGGRPGHIFNLGHGILPSTPVDHVKALIDFVHDQSNTTV
jgi:uroporphyrinogen decarboxylase